MNKHLGEACPRPIQQLNGGNANLVAVDLLYGLRWGSRQTWRSPH
jgi:hypothetical protein